jgi:hypothetical protein
MAKWVPNVRTFVDLRLTLFELTISVFDAKPDLAWYPVNNLVSKGHLGVGSLGRRTGVVIGSARADPSRRVGSDAYGPNAPSG